VCVCVCVCEYLFMYACVYGVFTVLYYSHQNNQPKLTFFILQTIRICTVYTTIKMKCQAQKTWNFFKIEFYTHFCWVCLNCLAFCNKYFCRMDIINSHFTSIESCSLKIVILIAFTFTGKSIKYSNLKVCGFFVLREFYVCYIISLM